MILLPKYKGFQQERQVGEYKIILPDPPSITKIANYGKSKENQKFIPLALPKDIMQWDEKDRSEFEKQEWDKRLNGYWFYNNGEIEYITGSNYFYVNYWKIDIGLPSYVDADRDFFYLWKHVEDSPKARGLVFMCRRRSGKTYRGTCLMYEALSRTANSLGSIQSKSDGDAKKVFEKLTFSWRKLPYFFKPIDVGESHPKSRLEFSEPSVRNTKNLNKEYTQVLDSTIDYTNAKEEALDGTKQFRHFNDEAGKCVDIDVDSRMNILKECVMDGSDIIGKIFCSSTVEEMEKKGGKNFKKIWDKADPNKLMPNGETEQGMLRLFQPAYYGYRGKDIDGVPFVDEYGNTDQERAKRYLDSRLAAIKSSEDIASERRKYPQTVRDCFISEGGKSVYDTIRIEQQLNHNETLPDNILVRGNFEWRGGIKDTEVIWVPKDSGKWLVSWMPKNDTWNKKVMKLGKISPGNSEGGCFGLDPYDNKTTVDDRKSDAACYGFRKFDPLAPYDSGIFISEYVNRPRLPELMWEDVLMQCVFFGWEILIESNKIGTINYFRMRGYDNYLMDRPNETHTDYSKARQEEKGIPMSGEEARLSLVYATQSYIGNKIGLIEEEGQEPYMGKCYFDKLLEQWRDFDFQEKWTKYDCMVAGGLALLGSRKAIPRVAKREALQYFPIYKNGSVVNNKTDKPPEGFVIRDM